MPARLQSGHEAQLVLWRDTREDRDARKDGGKGRLPDDRRSGHGAQRDLGPARLLRPARLPSRRSAMSARSLGLPAALLLCMSSRRPRNATVTLPIFPRRRPSHATFQLTPLMLVSTSIRNGSRPRNTTVSARVSCSPSSPRKPNASRARTTRRPLTSVGSTSTSRSPVRRGLPCAATACAPTMTNRTRFSLSNLKNSIQSS